MSDVLLMREAIAELRQLWEEWVQAEPGVPALEAWNRFAQKIQIEDLATGPIPVLLTLAEQALTVPRLPYVIEKDGQRYEAATVEGLHELMVAQARPHVHGAKWESYTSTTTAPVSFEVCLFDSTPSMDLPLPEPPTFTLTPETGKEPRCRECKAFVPLGVEYCPRCCPSDEPTILGD